MPQQEAAGAVLRMTICFHAHVCRAGLGCFVMLQYVMLQYIMLCCGTRHEGNRSETAVLPFTFGGAALRHSTSLGLF